MVTERPGPGLPYSRRDILRREADGRLISLMVEAGGKTAWTVDYRWNGSDTGVLAVLRDASGSLIAYDDLDLGGGAAGSKALRGTRHAADGSVKGELSAAIDSSGRLSFIARSAPEPAPAASAGAPAGSAQEAAPAASVAPGSAATGAPATPEAGPPPPELGAYLLPPWPGSGPWTWSAAAAAGMVSPPFPEPHAEKAADKGAATGSGAAADFLYDEAGRLLRARLMDGEGYLLAGTDYRWDALGRLAETKGESSVTYRYEGMSSRGLWTERRLLQVPDSIPAPVDESLFLPVSRETRAILSPR